MVLSPYTALLEDRNMASRDGFEMYIIISSLAGLLGAFEYRRFHVHIPHFLTT